MSFPDFLSWENADRIPWASACCSAVYDFCDAVKKHEETSQPDVVRASLFDADQAQDYPAWLEPFKAGQLFAKPAAWHVVFERENVRMSTKLQKWVDRQGYGIYIDKDLQGKQPGPNVLTQAELAFAQSECDKWIASGAVQEIPWESKHPRAKVCNVVVAYRDGKMERVCWSGASVNEGVEDSSFRMEQVKHILDIIEPGDWAFSLDFEKGFHQVPLDQTREFLLFRIGNKLYRWNVLPMGLKSAPKHFSAIVKQVLQIFRQRGIRCAFYIDDVFFLARTKQDAIAVRRIVLDIFYELGFRVSLKKSLLNPGQLILHLGFDICTADCTIWIVSKKVERIRHLIHEILSNLGKVTGRQLSALVGLLRSNTIACSLIPCFSVGLAMALATLPVLENARASRRSKLCHGKQPVTFQILDYSAYVWLSDLAIAELRLWSKCIWKLRFQRFGRLVANIIFADACPEGFGAVLCSVLQKLCPADPQFLVEELATGNWADRCNDSSTTFELLTLLLTLSHYAERLSGRRVHLCTDNVGAAFIAGKGTKKNPRLHFWALQLLACMWKHDIQLSTTYLAGDGIIVSGADALSRGADVYACVLRSEVFDRIWRHFGELNVDAWAAKGAQQKHPRSGKFLPCISPFACPNRVGVDAMSAFDCNKRFYAFPPVPLLGRYIALLVRHKQPAVLVVPDWVTQPWWAVLKLHGQKWLNLGCAAAIFDEKGVNHPFGRNFEAQQAAEHLFWAVSLFFDE